MGRSDDSNPLVTHTNEPADQPKAGIDPVQLGIIITMLSPVKGIIKWMGL
jgi:hypothetical protein